MDSDNYILIKIIIVLCFCQSWRPTQCVEDWPGLGFEYNVPIGRGNESESDSTQSGPVTEAQETLSTEPEKTSEQMESEMDGLLSDMKENSSQPYSPWGRYWQNLKERQYYNMEWAVGAYHIGDSSDILRSCFHIGTTYKNARTDMRHYFRMRFLYVNNLHYEIGYMTHEVVSRYQMLLEMFHIVQGRFYHNQTRDYAPVTYMLYMYTHILDMSRQIIHFCNMMHELQLKYRKHPKTVFQDYQALGANLGKKAASINAANVADMKALEKRREQEHKSRMKAMKKKRNEFLKTGVYVSTERTRRRVRVNKHDFLHYGWSIEDW